MIYFLRVKRSKGLKDKKGNFIIKSGATFKKDVFVNLIENQNYLLSEFDYDSEWSDNARANSGYRIFTEIILSSRMK
ncbi:MAG: hypothetical protein R2942_11985 [Ignavibacteria bacterium]